MYLCKLNETWTELQGTLYVVYVHGRQSDQKSVGAVETFPDFSKLRDFDVRNLQYIRDQKIYGCKCTR